MSKSITSFFSPKRGAGDKAATTATADATETDSGQPPAKKGKKGTEEEPSVVQAALEEARKTGVAPWTSMGASWRKVLAGENTKPYWPKLQEFLKSEAAAKKTILPSAENVFSWSRACSFEDVKVVILGQDPYPGLGQAHGLCFSVMPGVPVPGSLKNMYKELTVDVPGFAAPKHGYLMSWAKQGVLLLNTVLTVEAGKIKSHSKKGWEELTDAVIDALSKKHKSNLVFMLWGRDAQSKMKRIDGNRHLVLTCGHPSPLSVKTFENCRHFSKANAYLKKMGRQEIDWASICNDPDAVKK